MLLSSTDPQSIANVLKYTTYRVRDDSFCQKFHVPWNDGWICASPNVLVREICKGDSGGPLFYYIENSNIPVQIGIISHGYKCDEENSSAFVRISHFSSWIEEKQKPLTIKKNSSD